MITVVIKQHNHGINIMAFVNELIPQTDKDKIDRNVFRHPFGGAGLDLWKWTVDREREAFLICLSVGRSSEGIPSCFALSWKGNVIMFNAQKATRGDTTTGEEVFWSVFDVNIPEPLQSRQKEVLEIIQQAMETHGLYYSHKGISHVNVSIC